MALENLLIFFRWMTVLNVGILAFSAIATIMFNAQFAAIHHKLFKIDPEYIKKSYMNYLAIFKILTIVFAITPYLALSIMA